MLPSPETSVRIRWQHTCAPQSPCLKCGPRQPIDYVSLDLPWMVRLKDSDSLPRRAWAFRVASIYWKSATDPSLIKTVSDKEVWMATPVQKEQTTWEEISTPHHLILKCLWKNPAIWKPQRDTRRPWLQVEDPVLRRAASWLVPECPAWISGRGGVFRGRRLVNSLRESELLQLSFGVWYGVRCPGQQQRWWFWGLVVMEALVGTALVWC